VAQKVTTGVYKGVTTSELDELAAETAASLTSQHPDYALVSERTSPWVDRQQPMCDVDVLNMTCMPPLPSSLAAGGTYRRVQPAQVHQEELLADVRSPSPPAVCLTASCGVRAHLTAVTRLAADATACRTCTSMSTRATASSRP
jgi:hypothetical protein